MKVLLIQPRIPMFIKYKLYPLGISYLAACCPQDAEVKIFDQQFDEGQSLDDLLNTFRPDIVGISIVSAAFNHAAELARHVRNKLRSVYLVAGGPHPTALPKLTLERGFDCVVRGEGEKTFTELVSMLERGGDIKEIKGISFKNADGIIVHNPDRELIRCLDELPLPYSWMFPDAKRYQLMSVLSSRGCPMRCAYCSNSSQAGHTVRFRSAESFVGDLELLYHSFGIQKLYLADDQFTANPQRTGEICDLIMKRGLRISWYASSRTDTVSYELLQKMQSAGCATLTFGIESGSQEILDRMNKQISLKTAAKAIDLCKKVGIKCRTTWIVGFPGSMQEQLKSITFMKELQPDEIVVFICGVYPGTDLWINADTYGIHIDRDSVNWDKDLEITEFDLDYMTHEQVYEIAERMVTEMRKLHYITSTEHTADRVSNFKIIRTFLEEGIEKKHRLMLDMET